MSDGTKIEWTDATWNPVTGCSVVSPGCTNCYAMRLAGTRLKHHPSRAGLTVETKAGPVWNGEVRLNEEWLNQPLRWKRPRRIFVCAHGDLFHEHVPDGWIDRVFAVMALAPRHTFQVLTKRAQRMRDYVTELDRLSFKATLARMALAVPTPLPRFDTMEIPPSNLWLGVSVEDQARADERIPDLLATPAAVRFVSAEPLLGPIDLTTVRHHDPKMFSWLSYAPSLNALTGQYPVLEREPRGAKLSWVIVGGESGRDARPMHPDWARSLRDQCQGAGVAFFFKQWGEFRPQHDFRDDFGCHDCRVGQVAWPNGTIGPGHRDTHGGLGVLMSGRGKSRAGRDLDGREWNEFPKVEAR